MDELVQLSKEACACGKVNMEKCLICGDVLCEVCSYYHKKKHGYPHVSVNFREMRIVVESWNKSERAEIYEN